MFHVHTSEACARVCAHAGKRTLEVDDPVHLPQSLPLVLSVCASVNESLRGLLLDLRVLYLSPLSVFKQKSLFSATALTLSTKEAREASA